MSDPYEREAAKAAIQTLERKLARVTEQRDNLAKAIANHNEEALHASTTKNADKKLWDTLADMEGLNYD